MGPGRVWVGGLPMDVRESELEDFFHKYGRITEITIRNRKPPAFAYVEFADPRDADDAVRGRNGVDFGGGFPVKCDIAKEERRGFGPGPYGGPPMGGRSAFPPSRKTRYKVIVEGLPESASWQDLKDHMREAGDVTYVQVYRDDKGTYGLVDYATLDDMERAIRKIDDTKFKNPYDSSYITVRAYEDPAEARQDRPRRRSRSRSPSRSRADRGRSRSPRDRSPRARSPRNRSPRDPSPRDRSPRERSPSPRPASPARD